MTPVTFLFGVPVAPAPTKWQPPSFAQKLMCLHPLVARHRSMQSSADFSTVRHALLPLPHRLQLQPAATLSIGLYTVQTALTFGQSADVGAGVGAAVGGGGGTGAAKFREPQTVYLRHDLEHDMMVCSKLCSESSGSSIGKFYRGDPPGGCIASTRLTNCPSGW